MFNKMSIRQRLTMMTVTLLTICSIGLTIILNFSADKMVTIIDATPAFPAQKVDENDRTDNDMEDFQNSITHSTSSVVVEKARNNFRMESITYMFIVIIAGGFSTYYIAGKALKPLNKLNSQIKNINANNLSETLSVPSTEDEIAELTATFNEMTSKLNDSFEMQRRFSANAAHELRTPLSVLQTKIDVFKKVKTHSKEDYDTLISVIEKQTKRLRELVGQLLDMSNLDASDDPISIDAKVIFEEIISDLSYVAKDFNVSLSLNCDNSVIFGNIDLLYRAFYNLVENGIRYNTDQGTVDIIVKKCHKEQVAITIKDTGIGISDKDKKHIFEPFYRADKSRSRQHGGTGLGLSMVKDIIKKHNGTITCVSNENGGTSFHILLPNDKKEPS